MSSSTSVVMSRGSQASSNVGSSLRERARVHPAVVFLGRLLFTVIFVLSGPRHFMSQTIAYAAAQGVPLASIAVPLSGVLALLGGLSVLFGYRAKIGAWLVVLFLIAVTPMHNFWAVKDPMMAQMQMAMFMKNLSMLGGALLITQLGSGPWSLDSRS